MKKILIAIIILALNPLFIFASTKPTLSIKDVSLRSGSDVTLFIELNSPQADVSGVQFDLYLPDGVSFKLDNGNEVIRQTADRINEQKPHTLEWSHRVDDSMRILNYSSSNQLFKGTSGSIIEITLVTDSSLYKGVYSVRMNNIVVTHPDGTTEEQPNTVGNINILGRQIFRLTYLIDNEPYKSMNGEYGVAITNPTVIDKDYYTFSGWDKTITSMPSHNDTIRGRYIPEKFYIQFKTSTGRILSSGDMDYGSSLTVPTPIEISNYTFVGWDKTIPATVPAENAVYTAIYKLNQYTYTFLDNDGTLLYSFTQDYQSPFTAPESPTKVGYTFNGWSRYIPDKMYEDRTFVASYKANKYKVLFIVDGDTISNRSLYYEYELTPPYVKPKSGYTFSGWDKSDRVVPAHDITFTGSYLSNPHMVTFLVDGESFYELNVEYGKTISQISAPIKDGYTFKEWNGMPSTMPDNDISVTAVYAKNTYQLTFYDYDGSTVLEQKELSYGDAISVPSTNPTRQGYTFQSWQSADGKSVVETMPASNLSYTAQYNVNTYALSLYSEDNSLFKTYTVDYGTVLNEVITELPSKTGYDFTGWIKKAETQQPETQDVVSSEMTMPDSDLSLTAIFQRTTYDVDGVSYTPDINTEGTALTGYATVTGISQSGSSSAKKVKVLRAKYEEQQTEARAILIPSTITPQSLSSLTVATIAKSAFSGSDITSITIPETVTKIEESAVAGCDNLQSVVFLGETSPEMESGAIEVNEAVEVYVPSTADESFSEALKQQSGTEVEVTKADAVSNYSITVYKAGETEPSEVSNYSFGDNVVLTAPEKKYYDVMWTDRTSNLVSYSNPYIFSAVRDVQVEWTYKVKAYTVGDVNSDGSVDILDVTALIKYLNTRTTAIHELAADADNDGDIDTDDVMAIADIVNKIK